MYCDVNCAFDIFLDPAEFQAAVKWWLGMNSSVSQRAHTAPISL